MRSEKIRGHTLRWIPLHNQQLTCFNLTCVDQGRGGKLLHSQALAITVSPMLSCLNALDLPGSCDGRRWVPSSWVAWTVSLCSSVFQCRTLSLSVSQCLSVAHTRIPTHVSLMVHTCTRTYTQLDPAVPRPPTLPRMRWAFVSG